MPNSPVSPGYSPTYVPRSPPYSPTYELTTHSPTYELTTPTPDPVDRTLRQPPPIVRQRHLAYAPGAAGLSSRVRSLSPSLAPPVLGPPLPPAMRGSPRNVPLFRRADAPSPDPPLHRVVNDDDLEGNWWRRIDDDQPTPFELPPAAVAAAPPPPEPEEAEEVDEAFAVLCLVCTAPIRGDTARLICEAGHGCCNTCAVKLETKAMRCPSCRRPFKMGAAPVWNETLDKLNAASKRIATHECELVQARGKIAKLHEELAAAEKARAAAEAEAREAQRAVVRVVMGRA